MKHCIRKERLGHKPELSKKETNLAVRKRNLSWTDKGFWFENLQLHRSEKNQERHNAAHHFPLVLPIANYKYTHKEKQGECDCCVFQINRFFCHESW